MKKYTLILLIIAVAIIPVLMLAGVVSTPLVEKFNEKGIAKYEANEKSFGFAYEDGLPLDNYVVLSEIKNFKNANNIVVIGSSTTRDGILRSEIKVPEGWNYLKFSSRGVGINELYIMTDFIEKFANHELDETDIVKIDIGLGFFKNREFKNSILKAILEQGNVYKVSEDLKVSSGLMPSFLYAEFLKPQSLIGEVSDYMKNEKTASVTPYSKTVHRRYKDLWSRELGDFDISAGEKERFLEAVKHLAGRTNVVVENIYGGSWMFETKEGKEYKAWIESDLKPALAEIGVKFVDYSGSIENELFSEQSHLTYEGRAKYTHMESELFEEITNER